MHRKIFTFMNFKSLKFMTRRNLGGHGPSSYPNKAYAFGREPGAPLEGWEFIYGGVMASCVGLLVFGYGGSHEENFREWARREAVYREKAVENGTEIEYGKHYSLSQYEPSEDLDGMPGEKEAE